MNFGEMQTKVRRRLNELTTVFYSDDDVKNAINEGYQEMADATEFYEREAMVPMLKKRTYYDLKPILPNTFLSPRRIYNIETNRWLDPTDPRELDYHTYVRWELVEGAPEKYFLRGNWWMGVFPRPTKDSLGLRFYFTAIPPQFVESREEPEFPQEYHEGLISFALSDLLAPERESSKALMHWTSYLKYQNDLQQYVNQRVGIAKLSVL